MSTQSPPRLNAAGNFMLGLNADIFSVLALQPVDTLKTYLQEGKGVPPLNRLWHGSMANCVSAIPQGGIPFLVNGLTARYLFQTNQLSDSQRLINGILTGVIASTAIAPCDLVVKYHQAHGGTAVSAYQKALAEKGAKGMFKAIGPIAIREAIVFGTFFGTRSVVEKHLGQVISDPLTVESVSSLGIGFLAGAMTGVPDRISTAMQLDSQGKYPTLLSTMRVIIKEEGSRALFRGIGARMFYLPMYYLALGFAEKRIKPQLSKVGILT